MSSQTNYSSRQKGEKCDFRFFCFVVAWKVPLVLLQSHSLEAKNGQQLLLRDKGSGSRHHPRQKRILIASVPGEQKYPEDSRRSRRSARLRGPTLKCTRELTAQQSTSTDRSRIPGAGLPAKGGPKGIARGRAGKRKLAETKEPGAGAPGNHKNEAAKIEWTSFL
ncbi:hypothetical protein ElyMa_004145700 [Elysia marginata]|uniref:Uncharacterized protein n=1 Tax=Elysia marginata TaxID=1093978 RepID=A0AAV4GGN3_9GAST|nr:hypothetical protein ElyMa_004145700 [Elysia marginata]